MERDSPGAKESEQQLVTQAGGSQGASESAQQLWDEQVKLASLFVHDALEGRLSNGRAATSLKSKRAQRCFAIQTSTPFTCFVYACCGVQMLLVLIEPPASFGAARTAWFDECRLETGCGSWHFPRLAIVLELGCISGSIADIVLKMGYMGCWAFLKKPWQFLYSALVAVHLADLLLLTVVGRPFRLLRGGLVLLRFRSLRRMCAAVIELCATILRFFAVLLLGLLFFGALCAHLLMPSYSRESIAQLPASYEAAPFVGAFDDPLMGATYLFQLYTTESYPALTYPAYAKAGAWSLSVFVLFWYLLTLNYLNIQTAYIVDHYWELSQAQVRADKRKMHRGLMRAFHLLDAKGEGEIGVGVWEQFLRHLMPASSKTEARVRFAMLDLDGNGRIDALDFLHIDVQLQLRLHEVSRSGLRPQAAGACGRLLGGLTALLEGLRLKVLPGYSSAELATAADCYGSLCQLLLFALVWPGQSAATLRALCHISLGLTLASLLRLAWRLCEMGAHFRLVRSHDADVLLLTLSLACYVLIYSGALDGEVLLPRGISPFEWAFVPQLLMALRLLWKQPTAQRAVAVVSLTLPLLRDFTLILVYILFLWAVLGLELFRGCSAADTNYTHSTPLCASAHLFASFECALVSDLQVLVSNDWNEHTYLMQEACTGSGGAGSSRWAVHLYFALLYYALNYILSPVMLALCTMVFMKLTAQRSREGEVMGEPKRFSRHGRAPCRHSLVLSDDPGMVNVRLRASQADRASQARASSAAPVDRGSLPAVALSRRLAGSSSCNGLDSGLRASVTASADGSSGGGRQSQPQQATLEHGRLSVGSRSSEGSDPDSLALASKPASSTPRSPTSERVHRCGFADAGWRKRGRWSAQGGSVESVASDAASKRKSYYCVKMHKTSTASRLGGWRRELMRDELLNIERTELLQLSAAAKLDEATMVALWQQKRRSAEELRAHTPRPWRKLASARARLGLEGAEQRSDGGGAVEPKAHSQSSHGDPAEETPRTVGPIRRRSLTDSLLHFGRRLAGSRKDASVAPQPADAEQWLHAPEQAHTRGWAALRRAGGTAASGATGESAWLPDVAEEMSDESDLGALRRVGASADKLVDFESLSAGGALLDGCLLALPAVDEAELSAQEPQGQLPPIAHSRVSFGSSTGSLEPAQSEAGAATAASETGAGPSDAVPSPE